MPNGITEQQGKIDDTLTSIILELQQKYPSLECSREQIAHVPPSGYVEFRDLKLRRVMVDAYPTSLIDKFAYIRITSIPNSRDFEVYQRYDFGMERLPVDGGIIGPYNTNPRPEVEQIAEFFAKLIAFSVVHEKYRGRYAYSRVFDSENFATLDTVEEVIMQNVARYVAYGKATAPKVEI